VKIVFDAPMTSCGVREGCGRECAGGDIGSLFGLDFVAALDAALDHGDGGAVSRRCESAMLYERCCVKKTRKRYAVLMMKEGPSVSLNKEEVPNNHELLRSKAVVVNVMDKSRSRLRQV